MVRLSIIILSYNTKQYMAAALRSVEEAMRKDWEVIVVDNASTDGSVEMVKTSFPFVRLIKNKKNVGFAAGNNVGIRVAKGKYVMLLNSDAELRSGTSVETLLQYLDENPEVGAITPKILLADGTIDQGCHRGIPTPWNALTYFSGLEKAFGGVPIFNRMFGGYHQTWKNMREVHEIDACSGAAMIIRASAIDRVGLMDERFFMYAEDLDWCVRFREEGYLIVYYPYVTVLHHKNKSGIKKERSAKQDQTIKTRAHAQFFDTMVQFYEKHYLEHYPTWVRQVVYAGIRAIQHMKGA